MSVDYYDSIIRLTQEMSGQRSMVGVPRIYIKITKNLSIGAVLSQVVFWGGKSQRADGFFYHTAAQWQQELELSNYQITRIADRLVSWDLINKEDLPHNGTHKMHYRPVMANVVKWIMYYFAFDESPLEQLDPTQKYNTKIDLTPDEVTAHVDNRLKDNKVDPMSHVFGIANGGGGRQAGVAQPGDFFDSLEYNDQACKAHQAAFGEWLYPANKATLIDLALESGYDHDLWVKTVTSCANGGLKNPQNVDAMITVYRDHGGVYQSLYDDRGSELTEVRVDDSTKEIYKQMESET